MLASSSGNQNIKVEKKVTKFSLNPPTLELNGQESSAHKNTPPSRKKSMFHKFNAPKIIKPETRSSIVAGPGPTDVFYEQLLADGYSTEELDEYKQVFSMFDTDGSGSIGTMELANAMRSLGMNPAPGELENLIREVDQDGNGEIDFQEFCAVMKRMSAKKISWDDIIKQCFEVFDRNGSGSINDEDFRLILKGLGDIDDERVIDEIFTEFDVDGNGVIDYAEFSNMVKSYMTEEDVESCGK